MSRLGLNPRFVIGAVLASMFVLVGAQTPAAANDSVVPQPVRAASNGSTFELTPRSRILADGPGGVVDVGRLLRAAVSNSTGWALPVDRHHRRSRPGDITVHLAPGQPVEGYHLKINARNMALTASTPQGLFRGVQTLRQLLPAGPGAYRTASISGTQIVDYPRFRWRGAMLDVARHFFTVDQVKTFIDEIALSKVNFLHLHLTDDQGWRIAIKGWPRLTSVGASGALDGAAGGHYTQSDYKKIVSYAARRYVTVVPEIEGPAHSRAAGVAYPRLDCRGSLCVNHRLTFQVIDRKSVV